MFTLASALEQGAIGIRDRVFCENGTYRYAGRVIHDAHKHGWLDVPDVMKVSSNIGMIKIMEKMDPDRFHAMIRAFGFGTKTGWSLWGNRRGWSRRGTRSGGSGAPPSPSGRESPSRRSSWPARWPPW